MNFDLTEEQEMIVDAVQKFVANDSPVERFRKLREHETGWEKSVWKAMGEYGWLGVEVPEDLGGYGGRFVDVALILEQLGRGLVPEPYIASVVLAGGLLTKLGTDAQQEAYLAPMIAGDTSLAVAYGERQSRYDLTDQRTTAKKDGDRWVLDGTKVWVLNGHAADQVIVAARTSGNPTDRQGISLFIVDGEAEGVRRVTVPGMDGQKTGLLELSSVKVGADRLLGAEGEGHQALEWAVDRGAAAACAEAQGEISELFERTVAYLKQREQFGVPIGTFQALQHRAADMYAEVELCKSVSMLAAIEADSDDAELRMAEVSAAKRQLTHGGWFVQENAIQLFGGIGVTDEQDEGLFFKRVRVLQGLFGDADHHIGRYQSLERFDAQD